MNWILPPFLIAVFTGSAAFAQDCAPVIDQSEALSGIVAKLRAAPTELDARVLTDDLWAIWTAAPDATAQALLDEGMRKREKQDFAGARAVLDQLVAYCPEYAEGYNQRAFAYFLQKDFDAALIDLDRALEIVPNHVAALAGKGLTLLGLGRNDEAQEALKSAVALNPWLSERSLITDPIEHDI